MLRHDDLDRPPERARKLGRDRDGVGFQRPAGGLARGHRVGDRAARRLGRGPDFGAARGCGQRFEPKMLRRRDIISRRERARAANHPVIIAAAERFLRRAVRQRILEQRPGVGRRSLAGEDRVGVLERALGRPPAVGHDRDPLLARGDMADARMTGDGVARKAAQPTARRRHPDRGEQHVRQAHVAGKAPAPLRLGGAVEALQRLAHQARLVRPAKRGPKRRRAVRGLFRKLAEGEGAPAIDHEPVGGIALARADVPAVGGGADEHFAGDGGGFAQRLARRRGLRSIAR